MAGGDSLTELLLSLGDWCHLAQENPHRQDLVAVGFGMDTKRELRVHTVVGMVRVLVHDPLADAHSIIVTEIDGHPHKIVAHRQLLHQSTSPRVVVLPLDS